MLIASESFFQKANMQWQQCPSIASLDKVESRIGRKIGLLN